MNLDQIINNIAEKHVFNKETYPELANCNEMQAERFAIKHSVFHMMKTSGKIAAICEDIDHGEKLDIEKLKKEARKSIVNSLRLAEILDITEEDIDTYIKGI